MGVIDLDRATLSDFIGALESDDAPRVRDYARGRISYSFRDREAYSYGRHFPLFRMLEGPGKRGKRARYLINGERWTGPNSRTNEHQAIVRSFLSDAETLIVPFGALRGAGIDLDSVRALSVLPDRTVTVEREARTLEEMPKHLQRESFSVDRQAEELGDVPAERRTTYRTPIEGEDGYEESGYSPGARLPILPGPDGLYRWSETHWRVRRPDSDGIYRWTETRHVLGESVFSAIREESSRRPAQPFETETHTASRTVELHARGADLGWRASCSSAPENVHVAGPSGACIHCELELEARVVSRRRRRYLSGFDTNENPPLYFLCELPRGAPIDVEGARLSLAPAAVHAAIARGRIVERQGDIFLVDTELTRAELEQRGARFARLTQWTRDAKPRRGEVGYVAPLPAKVRRRRAAKELKRAREIWHAEFSAWSSSKAVYHQEAEEARAGRRLIVSAQWAEMLERHRAELEQYGPDALSPCRCGAGIGEACARIPDTAELERLRGAECPNSLARSTLLELHRSQVATLRSETRNRKGATPVYLAPRSEKNIRRETARRRARALERVELRREELRLAVFSQPKPRQNYRRPTRTYGYACRMPNPHEQRADVLERIERARKAYAEAWQELERETLNGYRSRTRDEAARAPSASVASYLWARAKDSAQLELRPETVGDTGAWQARRDAVRRAVSIYGTAHTATEVARIGGAVYARGIVRHVPELERGRGGNPDHRPVFLTPERWYLCVRNTVPRASRAR